ncbi:TPA: TetR/AcrR family transcriptional regulator, partial [Vibrio cholerae]
MSPTVLYFGNPDRKTKRIMMKTKDRIVHAALELFNQQGERNITTNHIAAHIEISPGNLYYHFRNKQEIVRDIFAL